MSRRTMLAACAGATIASTLTGGGAAAQAQVKPTPAVPQPVLTQGPASLAVRPSLPPLPISAHPTVLEVGPGKTYKTISLALGFANKAWGGGYNTYDQNKARLFQLEVTPGPNASYYDDDTGTYSPKFNGNDGTWPPFAGLLHGPCIIQGVPGSLIDWKTTQDGALYYGKGQVITGDYDLTVRRMKMGGDTRRQTTGNISAIRFDTKDDGRSPRTGNFLLEDCEFFGCDNGILGGSMGQTLTIRRCDFHDNGNGDGLSHNAYAALFDVVWVDDILSHSCNVGHLFKSRGAVTVILNSRLVSNGGTESACLDVPNGGVVWIENTLMVKGPKSDASWAFHYGGENDANVTPRPNSIVVARNLTMAGPPVLTKSGAPPEGFVNQSATGLAKGATDGVNAVKVGIDPSSTVSYFGFPAGRVGFPNATALRAMPAVDLKSPIRLT